MAMGLGFMIGVQLARGLGPSGYGMYGIAMSVISLMMIPLEFGIPQLVTREVAATPPGGIRSTAILTWSWRVVMFNSLILLVIAVPAILWNSSTADTSLRNALLCGLLMLPTVAASNIVSASLRGLQRVIEGQIAELIIRPAVISLSLFVLWQANSHVTAPMAMTLNAVAAVIGAAEWVTDE